AAHLLADPVAHGGDVEGAALASHLGVEDDLEQQVAELGPELVWVAAVDRLRDLVGFLDDVTANRSMVLLAIPRTAARAAQAHHDLDQAIEFLHRNLPSARISKHRPSRARPARARSRIALP